ncbi:hypothetical protein [Klebsiella quasipneumoniae]|uniref:hypothetical protein n=1 Tax=Klebsiella quasipneumoniae TaxID=1463165 RepID=UPI001495ECAB|nr:hypothetical protein [Klebsiella quasipneumoniae]
MSLFIQLPVTAPATIGTVAEGDIEIFLPFDSDATEFWNFRRASLVAANDATKSLTPQGNYSFSGNALNVTTGGGNNLKTSLVDDGEFSFCGVVSHLGPGTTSTIIAGNYLNSVAGTAIYKASGGVLSVRAAAKLSAIGVPNASSPLFFGVSISKSSPALSVVVKQPGTLDFSVTGKSFATPYVESTEPVTLGSLVGGAVASIPFYEFATYDRPLTLAELNAKYQQAKVRMNGLGISI